MKDYLFREDAIAAVSTPPGRGAIGIIRVTGPQSYQFVSGLWQGGDVRNAPVRTAVIGKIGTPESGPIDECLLLRFEGPHSFTGEDLIEIHSHGNPAILSEILEALFRLGVRPAEPGEFTFRAFRNGRISLLQAESVAQIIDAKGAWARRNALAVLAEGGDAWVRELADRLLDVWTVIEADLEFPTDDLDALDPRKLLPQLRELLARLEELSIRSTRYAKLQEGYRIVIAGAPNAGKSSLLNALLGYGRALVTDIPGTTRDTLEEAFDVRGIPVRLVDTAGLGESRDFLDALGMERSRAALGRADLILWVVDGSTATPPAWFPPELNAPVLVVVNKQDLFRDSSPWAESESVLLASAREGLGLERILDRAAEVLTATAGVDPEERLMLNQRQADRLDQTAESIRRAVGAVESAAPLELVAQDLSEARRAIEELSGRTIDIDLMEAVFSRFCIGK